MQGRVLQDGFLLALAREMHDQDRVFTGANQIDVALAAYLARSLWAPHLRLWASGGPRLDPTRDTDNVGRGQFDPWLVHQREAFWWQARAFDDLGVRPVVCFAGGLQVDARGNTNLEGLPGATGGWALRGPGSAGLPDLTAWAQRFYVIVSQHTRLTMVPKCARITVVGDPLARAAVGLKPDSLEAVITPLARFEPTTDGLVLTELASGVDLEEVQSATGFPVVLADEVRRRAAASDEEDAALARLVELGAGNRNRGHPH